MAIRPYKPYFLVRIPKEEQQNKKEKIGSLYTHFNYVWLTRNMQCGEIVGIGEKAAKEFPEAKVGNILLIHHFVESSERENLIDSDEKYNYYVVNYEQETYGVYDGEKIIPFKNYIFLETEKPACEDLPKDDFINKATTESKGGLIIFKEWKETRVDLEEQMAEIKKQIESLCKTGMTDAVKADIGIKEAQMNKISKEINKKQYVPFTVACSNPLTNEWFDIDLKGQTLYCLNIAAKTELEFNDKKYIVLNTEFIGFLYPQKVIA